MYSIYYIDNDGKQIYIYDNRTILDTTKAISPKLELADNTAGSLEIIIAPGNAGYSQIKKMSTEIVVQSDYVEIWRGRVIDEKNDFLNRRILTCEGELAYLNDTTQPQTENDNMEVADFLTMVLNAHNAKVADNRKFYIGNVTVTGTAFRVTNYETTISSISENLLKVYGGHLMIRKVDGLRYLDYISEPTHENSQSIAFGVNLLDFITEWDISSIMTVLIPRGMPLGSAIFETIDEYTTVASVNNGSIYVKNNEAIAEYGWIERVVDWEDVDIPSELLVLAQEYMANSQFMGMILTVTAVDLHYLSVDYESIKILDKIQCISKPHGLNQQFVVSKLSLPLDAPQNTSFTLGINLKTSLSSSTKATNEELLRKIELLSRRARQI